MNSLLHPFYRVSMALLLVGLLATCNHNSAPVPASNNTAALSSTPQILEMSILGIPAGNITINQIRKVITILLPANLQTRILTPTFKTSAGSLIIGNTNEGKYVLNLCSHFGVDVANNAQTTPYTIELKAQGQLAIGTLPDSYELETGSTATLPVVNYYDDATEVNVILTRQGTAETYRAYTNCCSDWTCENPQANAIGIQPEPGVPPGNYTISIEKSNGRKATANKVITIKRGLPTAGQDYYNPPSPGTTNFRMVGVNLFAEDKIQLLLKNRKGDQYTLTPTSYTTDGMFITVDLPATMKPSQYAITMLRNGQPVPSYSRFIISTSRSQPAIMYFRDPAFSLFQDPDKRLLLPKQKDIVFHFVMPGIALKAVRLRLVSSSDPAKEVFLDVAGFDGYLKYGPDGGGSLPSFVVPQHAPAGVYSVILQFITADGKLLEGEPLERDVEIQ